MSKPLISLKHLLLLSIQCIAAMFSVQLGKANALSHPQVGSLKCEYLICPIGIDAPKPRLIWILHDESFGALQTAYQVYVGTDSLAVDAGKGDVWQTAKINLETNLVTYNGKPLKPFTKYFWKVKVWDKDKLVTSGVSNFETGMMNQGNWKGTWISDGHNVIQKAAPYFRNNFQIYKKIKSARAYIAVAGLYELYLNGKKIGNHRMDPMYTRFDRRTLYVTHDVTAQLQSGSNAVGVLLGNGWYNHQSTAVWYFHQAPWRNRPTFCMDLRITYTDGSTQTISSDTTWRTSLSPVTFNSIYTAEHYDARLEQPGWNTASFVPAVNNPWKGTVVRAAPSQNIVSQAMPPIRAVETIPAKSITKINAQTYLFNIGRNISGVSKLTVKGERGTVIRLMHAERLDKSGKIDQSNIIEHYRPTDDQDPFQTDIFILSGNGEESFMPKFNYKGFQYVEVTADKPIELSQESLTAYFTHSDVTPVGEVETSNALVNKIWQATNNSYLSNFQGYPTDCPQREKNGWTGDGHIASETGLYSFDGITIYEKWMADHRDEQQPNGVLPAIIPTSGWGYDWANGPDWTSTIAIIPWNLYQFYGDTKPLTDNYDNIKRYVDHVDNLYPTGITNWGLGDWVPVKSITPMEFITSTYYFVDANILAKSAGILNRKADEAKYTALALKIKNAINAKYLDVNTGIYDKGYQTEQAVPLFWGLVPEGLKTKVAANLAQRVKEDNFHLDVGILGAKALLGALSDNGYADVAYTIASQETYPSWGWWMVNGATTLYENWNIQATHDISLNHIMFGEIGAWLYKGIGGIKIDPAHPGFKNIVLQPHFVKGLQQYQSSHNGPYGKIISSWKREGDVVIYTTTIPANSTALLTLPVGDKKAYLNGKLSGNHINLVSGTYQFTIK
ncbi:alpha-L-rhamnosidase [Mucilaginibacter gracilis]|nr:alpha-L-rhamnosidase [Mucilaginibacter gracilis]